MTTVRPVTLVSCLIARHPMQHDGGVRGLIERVALVGAPDRGVEGQAKKQQSICNGKSRRSAMQGPAKPSETQPTQEQWEAMEKQCREQWEAMKNAGHDHVRLQDRKAGNGAQATG